MFNYEAETTFLGCILTESSLIKETSILPEHFYSEVNKKTFEVIKKLEKNNSPIDLVTVVVESKEAVSKQSLVQMVQGVASIQSFKFLEQQILESYKIREAKRIQTQDIQSLTDIETVKQELEQIDISTDNDTYDHKQAVIEMYDEIENQPEGLSGYNTGFKELNSYLDGFQEGDLIVSAARPSIGKTAKMLAHAKNHCQNNQGISVVFSLEMDKNSLNKRMISSIGRINGKKMKNPKRYFEGKDWDKFTQALGELSNMHIYIYDKPAQTLSYIKKKVREIRKQYPEKQIMVFIDYLQLIRPDQKHESKNVEVGEISRSLKEIAKSEKVPVYLLSQLSRAVTTRQDKRPIMSDIRDSGSVEQDADIIEFLHREDYYEANGEKDNLIEVIIAKQRNGPVGTVNLAYYAEHNGFYDLVYEY